MSNHEKKVQCTLDPALVNADTLPMMKNVGLSIFASACSKNRGAFVLDPPDGKTYGCLAFPDNILEELGISSVIASAEVVEGDDAPEDLDDGSRRALRESSSSSASGSDKESSSSSSSGIDKEISSSSANQTEAEAPAPTPLFTVHTVEDLTKHYADGNLTSANTVDLLDFLVTNVYSSTPNADTTPYACDVSGVVTLDCGVKKTTPRVRAVTMAGVFTPALWATDGEVLSLEQASAFYTPHDFKEMKKLGLNTVQIPVPTKVFSHDYKHAVEWKDLLYSTLHDIVTEGLEVILLLEQVDSPSESVPVAVEEAALFAQEYNRKHSDEFIIAVTLPSQDMALLEAATGAAPDLNIWLPTKGGDFKDLHNYPQASAAALKTSNTATVADIASSNSQEDRAKLFYHESTACIARAPLEYSACYQDMPVMVATGFDLAIDDCHLKDFSETFKDYGQCDRFNETIDSPWWKDHRYSFAARQLFAYEQGKGWSFAAWKLYESDPEAMGVLDAPAKLLAFKQVVAAGLMPSLFDLDEPIVYPLSNTSSPVGLACLNPPVADFAMGDATFAPTPAPPPDCGNGWWNATTAKCDYWIPPTPAPTAACPVCSNDTLGAAESVDCPDIVDFAQGTLEAHSGDKLGGVVAKAFGAGALVSALLCIAVFKMMASKRRDYEEVPSHANGNGNGYQA